MTEIEILKRKISEIEKYFQYLKILREKSKEKIKTDIIIYGAVERYLYLLCQAVIDFGEIIISYFSLRKPGSYKEIFEILSENNLIKPKLSLKMQQLAGFRNILAHSYGKIDFEKLYQILTQEIDEINVFLREIKSKINLK